MFVTHLNTFAAKTAAIEQKIQAQDQTVTALLLLKRQVQSAGLTECVTSPSAIHNLSGSSDFATLTPYQILEENDPLITEWHLERPGSGQMAGKEALLLHQRVQSFYVDAPPTDGNISAPSWFKAQAKDFVVIDDCRQALLTTILQVSPVHKKTRTLIIAGFTPGHYHYPVSISLIRNRIYYLGKTTDAASPEALYRSDHHKKREQILPYLSAIRFNTVGDTLHIEIKPQRNTESYYVSI